VDGRPGKLIYVQSTDQVWVQQQRQKDDDDDDDDGEIVVIRQASEHLLHHSVHIDQHQQLDHDNRLFTVRPLYNALHCIRRSVSQSVCLFSLKTNPFTRATLVSGRASNS